GLGTRPQRRQIRAGAWLREELAPQLVGRQDLREEAAALCIAAMGDQRGPNEVHADAVDDLGRPCGGDLLLEDVVLDHRGAAAALVARPVNAHPASAGELALPVAPAPRLVGQ